MSVPVILKVLAALASILVINHLSKRLLIAVAGGALLLAVWCGHSPAAMASIAWTRFASVDNMLLMLVVFQVIWLSRQMSDSGVMQDLVSTAQRRLSKRGAMAALPALIGFLPMPGGALFSAPLVDRCDNGNTIEATLKAQTNHWFRHVWEYWWPLYPGVLLAIELTGLDVWQFMVVGIPLSLGSIVIGCFFLLRRIPPDTLSSSEEIPRPSPGILPLILPIVVVIGVYAVVRGGCAILAAASGLHIPLNRYIPMALGIFCAMLALQKERPLPPDKWPKLLLSGTALNMVVIVAAVRVYGAFIEADLPDGTPLVAQMRSELAAAGIPVMSMFMLIPFVSGLTTGLAVGFVGASFPIVLSLLGPDPSTGLLMSTTVLAYSFGYVGMLISPVHICLIVTSEYFKTGVLQNSAALIKPSLLILAWSVLLYLFFRTILVGWA